MLRCQIFSLIFLLFGLMTTGFALADDVTFDYEPLGQQYGASVSMNPGDPMFSEGGTNLWITNFLIYGSPYFDSARIDPAFSSSSVTFGHQRILAISNVGVVFDFTVPGNVAFEYLDMGGLVNLQVNHQTLAPGMAWVVARVISQAR